MKSNEAIPSQAGLSGRLRARMEPFDSHWQAPCDFEPADSGTAKYYLHNYLGHLPDNRNCEILVISCGPGHLVDLLGQEGYRNVLGIDSDAEKIACARNRDLNCRTERAFEHLASLEGQYDVIIPEQELNHLTREETLEFLALCRKALRDGGVLVVHGLNGANPLVGSASLAQSIDHFYTLTEHSLKQMLEYAKFREIRTYPIKHYDFRNNPGNYVGLAVTSMLHLVMRGIFTLYGNKVTILTRKIMATCRK
jgi:2-polyprenyl-3-methyl-5-hydroxy-6-metoxy-1,4-benzoquinol methylase